MDFSTDQSPQKLLDRILDFEKKLSPIYNVHYNLLLTIYIAGVTLRVPTNILL